MSRKIFPPIAELLPHDPPMIVIDEVSDSGDDWIETVTDINQDHMFFEPGPNGLPGWALIELMAQSIAAFAGLQAKHNGDPVRIGFLLGTRKMNISLPVIETGSRLHIRARRELKDLDGLSTFACTARVEGVEIASGLINVYQTRDGEFFRE